MSNMPSPTDDRLPNTAVLHQFTGIGDLVWHIQYIKAVAKQSRGGRVTLIAQPSTFARQILGHEPWIEEIIEHDHRPRRGDRRKAKHGGLLGIWRMAQLLKPYQFERIVLFSGRSSRGLLAALSGIPLRLGYGYTPLQRHLLNCPPYIDRYKGPGVAALKEAGAFAVAHGFCDQPQVPRLEVPVETMNAMKPRLSGLPRPLVAIAIGTSEPFKQWGGDKFAAVAERLAQHGAGVVLLGGPTEAALAHQIMAKIGPEYRDSVIAFNDLSILQSAAVLRAADACIGNDTGMVNVAAAVERPTFVLLGARPLLDHDPLICSLTASSLHALSVDAVWGALTKRLPALLQT